jgi:hypothetical protein
LIFHGHTPRLVTEDEKHVLPDQALESVRFSGQSGIREGRGGKQHVGFDPKRTLDLINP